MDIDLKEYAGAYCPGCARLCIECGTSPVQCADYRPGVRYDDLREMVEKMRPRQPVPQEEKIMSDLFAVLIGAFLVIVLLALLWSCWSPSLQLLPGGPTETIACTSGVRR